MQIQSFETVTQNAWEMFNLKPVAGDSLDIHEILANLPRLVTSVRQNNVCCQTNSLLQEILFFQVPRKFMV